MSSYGFTVKSEGTDWKLVEKGPPESLNEARYLPNKKNPEASLSIRVDVLKDPMSLEQYAKKWIRDYPGYGFTVLGNKTFSNHGFPGYVVDLVHTKKQKQIRQILYSKGRQAVILTCADDQKSFKETIKACNTIARSFQWIKKESATK
ncbi:MAG: hypothetical protein AB7H97_11500 [Pseudobdellovibrionaceae bacterium]